MLDAEYHLRYNTYAAHFPTQFPAVLGDTAGQSYEDAEALLLPSIRTLLER
jgi:hypothetical protein